LHQFSGHIIGRMGIPCPHRGVSLISVAVDASSDVISALTGKISACGAAQAALKKTMNSCAYEMNHYRRFL
jgi:putative iron-only hydrogenase system regulator